MTPPIFIQTFNSRTTSVATPNNFNCSARGNPPPTITWYRNGKLIENSYLVNYEPPTLRISSVEPEDQGIYECFAHNKAGEIKTSGHLTIRKKQQYKDINVRPYNVKCYPAGDRNLIVTFESKEIYTGITYYIGSKQPYEWQTPPLEMLLRNNSITIKSHLVPFRKHGIFLRGLMSQDRGSDGRHMFLSRLSDLTECATQGVPVHFTVSSSSSIFVWWTTDVKLTGYVIQFWHNDTDNPIPFTENIVGTVVKFPNNDNYLTWSEIEPFLIKLPAVARLAHQEPLEMRRRRREVEFEYDDDDAVEDDYSRTRLFARHAAMLSLGSSKVTEVKVSGNVTGILIPNTQKVIVRVLGSMEPDGEPLRQDLRYVPWKPVELNSAMPKTRLLIESEARSIKVTWNNFELEHENTCLEVCYKNVIDDLIQRGGNNVNCRKM